MSRKRFLSLMLYICTFLPSFIPLHAQEEEGEIIIISERVGKEIDQEEAERFKFFQNFKGFQKAVCYKLPDNNYIWKITFFDEITNELKVKYRQDSESSINKYRNYIDHFEEIQTEKHQYQNLSKPQTVSSDSGEIQARKVDADSSKKKTFCFSFAFGLPINIIIESGHQLLHVPYGGFSLRLLEFPIAFMFFSGSGYQPAEHEFSTYNILYMIPLSKSKKTNFFLGGGIGSFEIKEDCPYDARGYIKQKYTLYNFEVGCNPRLLGFLGSYTKVRYLYSKRTKNCIVFMLGIDFNFHFRI